MTYELSQGASDIEITSSTLCVEHAGQDPYDVYHENQMKNHAKGIMDSVIGNELETHFVRHDQWNPEALIIERGLVYTLTKDTRKIKFLVVKINPGKMDRVRRQIELKFPGKLEP
jgi:hypothetical protein